MHFLVPIDRFFGSNLLLFLRRLQVILAPYEIAFSSFYENIYLGERKKKKKKLLITSNNTHTHIYLENQAASIRFSPSIVI